MATKEIFVHLNGPDVEPVKIVLRSAKNADGLYRDQLKNIAFDHIGSMTTEQIEALPELEKADVISSRINAVVMWSTCLASVESPDGARHLPLEKFQELPDAEATEWRNEAYVLNGHWADQIIQNAAEAEKKSGTPLTG
jgi:hypothetical protein